MYTNLFEFIRAKTKPRRQNVELIVTNSGRNPFWEAVACGGMSHD
jgi:hypothetical protein